jgi:hypothetical protein
MLNKKMLTASQLFADPPNEQHLLKMLTATP